MVAGTLLTFIPAAGDYINAKLLGNTEHHDDRATSSTGSSCGSLDYPTAAALSFMLMLTILVIVIFYVRRAGTEELV